MPDVLPRTACDANMRIPHAPEHSGAVWTLWEPTVGVVRYAQSAIADVGRMLTDVADTPASLDGSRKACVTIFQGVWHGCSLEEHVSAAIRRLERMQGESSPTVCRAVELFEQLIMSTKAWRQSQSEPCAMTPMACFARMLEIAVLEVSRNKGG